MSSMNFRLRRGAFGKQTDPSEIVAPDDDFRFTSLELLNSQLENRIQKGAGPANIFLE